MDAEAGEQRRELSLAGRARFACYGTLLEVGAHGGPVPEAEALGEVDLAYHGGQDVAVLEVEVIVRPVEIGRHDGDVVGAVLQVEAFAELEPRDLSDGVGLIGVLQRAREELVLGDGLLGLARIDAAAAEEEQILHTVAEALADDILLDLEVLVDEVSAVGIVGEDPPDVGGGEDDDLGLLAVEERTDGYWIQ